MDLEREYQATFSMDGNPDARGIKSKEISALGDGMHNHDHVNPYNWIYSFNLCTDLSPAATLNENKIVRG